MLNERKSYSLIGFYLLLIYVLLQFAWWSYLMLKLNSEMTRLKSEVVLLKSVSTAETERAERDLQADLNKKRYMVIGEGSVFLGLLLLGVFQIRRSFKKETELARQQSNFLLSVTHELKSPIASTRLQLETLLLRDLDKAKQKEILVNAISDTDRLNALVENILLAGQIDKHNFVLHKQQANLSELLSQILSRVGVAGNHRLVPSIEPDLYLNLDKINFVSIIYNLIDNAVKYSPAGSEIKVELKRANNRIFLSVADVGVGIANEEKEKVFQKFYRIGNEETRTTKGTGLGLYIVSYLVSGHNGTIRIMDNKPRGSIFQLEFNF